MSMSVCLSVCLSTRITRKPRSRTSPNCLRMLPMAVALSSYDGVAIRYVLPVLRMTSCFHTTGRIRYSGPEDCRLSPSWAYASVIVTSPAAPEAMSAMYIVNCLGSLSGANPNRRDSGRSLCAEEWAEPGVGGAREWADPGSGRIQGVGGSREWAEPVCGGVGTVLRLPQLRRRHRQVHPQQEVLLQEDVLSAVQGEMDQRARPSGWQVVNRQVTSGRRRRGQ